MVLEHMQTAGEHLVRQREARLPAGFQQGTQVFGSVREVQNTHRIGPVSFSKRLAPFGSVRHRADLDSPDHLSSLYLSLDQFGKG